MWFWAQLLYSLNSSVPSSQRHFFQWTETPRLLIAKECQLQHPSRIERKCRGFKIRCSRYITSEALRANFCQKPQTPASVLLRGQHWIHRDGQVECRTRAYNDCELGFLRIIEGGVLLDGYTVECYEQSPQALFSDFGDSMRVKTYELSDGTELARGEFDIVWCCLYGDI